MNATKNLVTELSLKQIMFMQIVFKLIIAIGCLPLSWVRATGVVLGWLLYLIVPSRRRVVQTNLSLCFPHWSADQIKQITRSTFIYFAQAWLDRGWLWHSKPEITLQRLTITGAVHELQGDEPTVVFAPHFVGLDAGWTALTQQIPRAFNTIYTDQENKASDAWILQGRRRYGSAGLFGRVEGVKPLIAGLRAGQPLYLLPDMNFGPEESVFVPFYGVSAATVPSLSRFARLGRAKVVPVITRMTSQGYSVEVLPAWQHYPTDDATADTALMNARLQTYIDTMPAQYFWVHKRFKDRPQGETPPY
jgi:KDO2-lipid IV(A) lauroyltransferase